MSSKSFLTLISFLAGAALVSILVILADKPSPDEQLISRAVGAMCANHAAANQEKLTFEMCHEFCELTFRQSQRLRLCKQGADVRQSQLIAVENAMERYYE